MEKKSVLAGQASAEQIAKWQEKYGEIYSIEVGGNSICYLKPATRQVYRLIAATATGDPVRANEILLENCWIDGDATIKTDDRKFFGVSSQLGELLKAEEAVLKKL